MFLACICLNVYLLIIIIIIIIINIVPSLYLPQCLPVRLQLCLWIRHWFQYGPESRDMMSKNCSVETKFIYMFFFKNFNIIIPPGRKIKLQEKPAALKGEPPTLKKQQISSLFFGSKSECSQCGSKLIKMNLDP